MVVAEIIGHLIPWDEFVLKKRVPYFFRGEDFPKGPDVKSINGKSSFRARSQRKEVTIEEFVLTRKDLLRQLNKIPTNQWDNEIMIGKSRLKVHEYFAGLIKHDLHHFRQINHLLDS